MAGPNSNFSENKGFPKELQPRGRERNALKLQAIEIKQKLNFERVADAKSVLAGAPITGSDLVVEGGNGRSWGIREAYREGLDVAEKYRQNLIDNAERFGLDPTEIKKIPDPVLIRERLSEFKDRAEFARLTNQSDTAVMSPTETAQADAKHLTDGDLSVFEPSQEGDITAASNRAFVTAFMNRLGTNEYAGYLTNDGRYTKQFVDRVQAAYFTRPIKTTPWSALWPRRQTLA